MRVGEVKYTIKDGIVYDTKKLLQDVVQHKRATKLQAQTTLNRC